jgi:hypothetical protein
LRGIGDYGETEHNTATEAEVALEMAAHFILQIKFRAA